MQTDPIPADVAGSLSAFLARQGMEPGSVEDLLKALRVDLPAGQPAARRVYDALVQAATADAGARIEGMVAEIARLASVPVAPGIAGDQAYALAGFPSGRQDGS